MKLKKLAGFGAILAIVAAAATGCNNKPPYVVLQEAVDSTNVVLAQNPIPGIESSKIVYDEATNTVKYEYNIPVDLSSDEIRSGLEAGAQQIEVNTLAHIFTESKFDLGQKIVDAKANVLIVLSGTAGSPVEFMIESAEVTEAFDTVKAASQAE